MGVHISVVVITICLLLLPRYLLLAAVRVSVLGYMDLCVV